jgi:hypothetical protein
MAERPDIAPTVWSNPTWVLAVMHYPTDSVLLERIASGAEITVRGDNERAIQAEADRAGKVAGNVLAALYALSTSPWGIPEPSVARAIHIAERMAYEERNRGAPRGRTKIEDCYNAMRPVAHLWAAVRLHWEFPTRAHDELFSTAEGVRSFLRIARGVQDFARAWVPARTNPRLLSLPLLGQCPWLVPDEITPLYPPWRHKPAWLLSANATYKRRSR